MMCRVLSLDASGPPRKPRTWQEVAERADLDLVARTDARQPRGSAHAIESAGGGGGGSLVTLSRLPAVYDHRTELCPKKAADLRGESTT